MAEFIGVPRQEAETQVHYPNLRFEPGDHGATAGTAAGEVQRKAFVNKYIQGDPNAHPWNAALVERIEETQPKIMAIDGVGFTLRVSDIGDEGATIIPAFPDEVWLSLPTTPEKINREKSVLVVDGDPVNLSAPFGFTKNQEMQSLQTTLGNKLGTDEVLEHKVLPVSLFVAGIIDAAILASIVQGKLSKKEEKVLSRRTFLKGAAAVGLTAAASAYFEGGLQTGNFIKNAVDSTTEAGKERWLDVVNVVDPQVLTSMFEKMRTANVTLKTKDAIDHLNLPKDVSSSVIMGGAHSIDAENYIDSDVAAQNIISEYLSTISPIITEVLHRYPTIPREFVTEKIKSYLSQTYVHRVDQPNSNSFWTPDFPKTVAAATSTVAGFKSKRVEAALSDFH